MIQLICIDTVGRVSDHGAFDWSTSRWPHRCCEKFQDFGSLMATHFNVLSQEAGFFAAMGFVPYFSCFLLWMKVAFWVILRTVQKSSKKNPKSLLTLVEKTAHAARDIRRKTSAGTCCRTKNLKKNVRQATSHLKLGIRQLRDQLRLLDDTDTGEENLPWN